MAVIFNMETDTNAINYSTCIEPDIIYVTDSLHQPWTKATEACTCPKAQKTLTLCQKKVIPVTY